MELNQLKASIGDLQTRAKGNSGQAHLEVGSGGPGPTLGKAVPSVTQGQRGRPSDSRG